MRKTILVILIFAVFGAAALAQQFDSQAEQQLIQLTNQERQRAGLTPLKTDDRLTQAARAHTALMAQKKTLSHDLHGESKLSQRLAVTGIRFNNDAENVAYDSTIAGAHEGLMHSPPHRENILSPKYNAVGVGVLYSGDVYWVTEDFANRMQEYSTDEAENMIVAAWQAERRRAHQASTAVVRMSQLQRLACAMAKRGKLDTRSPLKLPGVRSAVTYTESDPAELPSNAVKMAHQPDLRRVGVGACFGKDRKFPAGVWWVCMVFY